MPTSLFNNLTKVARPAYRWARKPEGGGGCKSAGQPCSAFAVCMSGSLRSFWSTRLNIERALLLPNGPADLFAHVYYEPRRHDHRRGLQWLRNAPYSQAVVAEVFDETLEEDIVAGFVEYARLRAEDTFGITTQGKETSAWLSMLRKLQLANELRKAHEARRGRPYLAVVRALAARDGTTSMGTTSPIQTRATPCPPAPPPCLSTHDTRAVPPQVRTRPDLMFGDEVRLERLRFELGPSRLGSTPWTFLKSVMRRSTPAPTDVLYAPVPPATGALWRMCTKVPSFEERSVNYADCDSAPSEACTPSPAASLVGTSALCPCCEWAVHPRVARKVCNCNGLFPRKWERRVLKRGGTPGARNGSRREGGAPRSTPRGHAPVLTEGHAPWGERLLLDQLVIGTPRAMDVFAGLGAALPATFARNGAKGQRTLSELGFVTESLLGTHVARHKKWLAVRPVTWLQWGSKADTGQQRDWSDAGTHRGGREAWPRGSRRGV